MNTTPKIKPKSVYRKDRHNRVSIRLKGYDYSRAGLYFITICCHHRVPRFGVVVNGKMELNEFGKIAYAEWLKLSERFSNVELDSFQIMPDHMHGIIILNNPVGAGFTPAPAPAPPAPPPKSNPMQTDGPTATPDWAAAAGVDSRATAMVDSGATARVDSGATAMVDSGATARVALTTVGGIMVDSGATARVALTTVGGIVVDSGAAAAMVDSGATARGALTTVGGIVGDSAAAAARVDAGAAMVESGATARVAPTTVGGIVGAYKSMVSNRCLDIYKFKNETMGQFWHRNYYEHIIRDEQSYLRISKYIINNPLKWTKDKFYTK